MNNGEYFSIVQCNAPIYRTADDNGCAQLIEDRALIIERALTPRFQEATLRVEHEQADAGFSQDVLNQADYEILDPDNDSEPGITDARRVVANKVLLAAINRIFPPASENQMRISTQSSLLQVGTPEQPAMIMVTGGMTTDDRPTDDFGALVFLQAIELFVETFPRAGQPLCADIALNEDVDLTSLNDELTQTLAEEGWEADTEADYDLLNELTLNVGIHEQGKYHLIQRFLAAHNA